MQVTTSQFYSCFISHSSKDKEFADHLLAGLQNKGVDCFYAPHHLKIGDRFRPRIDEAIWRKDKLLLILSEHSIQSDWVREEVESCQERERRENRDILFPIRLDDAVKHTVEAWAASIRRQLQIGDFRKWTDSAAYTNSFNSLLDALKLQPPSKTA
jgi:hypothetical protein